MSMQFADGSKKEDVAKQLPFCLHNILTKEEDPAGYKLVQCMHAFRRLKMYASLTLHTSETIERGHAAALSLSKLIQAKQEYKVLASEDPGYSKSWNFPKAHSYFHLFDDIQSKGVTRNYNTKINENMHHPLKKAYQLRTNFKDIAPQVLCIDHQFYVAGIIQQRIDEQTEAIRVKKQQEAIGEGNDGDNIPIEGRLSTPLIGKQPEQEPNEGIRLKVPVKWWTFEGLGEAHATNPAFTNFRVRLQNYLVRFFRMYRLLQPKSSSLCFKPTDEARIDSSFNFRLFLTFLGPQIIHEFGIVKAYFKSKVDWTITCDYIRASSMFYGNPCYDVVMIDSHPNFYFARLILLFTCQVESKGYLLALVQPLNAPRGHTTELDRDMGLYRVRACPRGEAQFVPARTIICGAVAIQNYAADPSVREEYFIMDDLDEDLFVRMQSFQYRDQ
ncbi:hypothetical protein AAF712_008469 [Marasmius tenuissimus]|uniref:Uncharacterized protein n=1 Tax=Marasmius tenuissimus TaxID=585030 RepID=A0ABR2ZUL8_9AGAR